MMIQQIPPRRHLICYPGDGRRFDVAGMTITIKASDRAPDVVPDAPFTVYEAQIPPHFAALPAHVHRATTEWFYVLSGTLAFTLNDETIMARSGSFLVVTPGVVHTFWNPTAATATLLGTQSRADFADYLTDVTAYLATTSWPPLDMTPLHTLAAEYDQFTPTEQLHNCHLPGDSVIAMPKHES